MKVLIVEDDPLLRKTLADVLQLQSYSPLVASTGEQGVAQIESAAESIAVALVDIRLPDTNGVSMLEAIKRVSPLTEVIILTAYASLETAVASVRGMAFDYLQKPVDPEVLLKAVEQAVDRSVHRQAEEALKQRYQELTRFSARLLQEQEEERRKLSQDIHDDLGQILAASHMALGMAAEAENFLTAKPHLDRLKALLDLADERVYQLSFSLRPYLLDDLGLVPALQKLVEQASAHSSISLTLRTHGLDRRLPPDVETALYRVCQEALINILKHAQARSATITLWEAEEKVHLSVEGDGQGFRVEEALSAQGEEDGLGLTGTRERARLMGGTLTILSSPGHGTRIEMSFPRLTEEVGKLPADG